MAVQQQLSGTIVVIIIAMTVQVCIMLVIVVKRQIMRFALRNRRGPHTHMGQGLLLKYSKDDGIIIFFCRCSKNSTKRRRSSARVCGLHPLRASRSSREFLELQSLGSPRTEVLRKNKNVLSILFPEFYEVAKEMIAYQNHQRKKI